MLMLWDIKRWAFVFPPAHFATAWCIIALLLGLKCSYNIIETWRKWTPRWCPNSELVCFCAPSVCVAGCLLHCCLQFGCIKEAKWAQFYNTENSVIAGFFCLSVFCPSTSRDCHKYAMLDRFLIYLDSSNNLWGRETWTDKQRLSIILKLNYW